MDILRSKDQKLIIRLSIISRIFTLALGKIVSLYFQRFDKSSDLLPIDSPFKYLQSWDSIHYEGIAADGYTHEHSLPFFPLLPLIVRTLNFRDVLTTGVIFNNIIFVFSSLILFKISTHFFDHRFSILSTVIFIFNPASIVFSAFYTEGLFTLLFLIGLYYTINKKQFKAAVIFSLSTLCRSNGTVFIIFTGILYAPLVLLPVALVQAYSLLLIWRRNLSFKILIPYSLVQKKYWGQGFLKFFTTYHIPNLLIGLPSIACLSFITFVFFKSKINENKPNSIENLLLRTRLYVKNVRSSINQKRAYFYDLEGGFSNETGDIFMKLAAILGFQLFTLIFYIHWNITLRFVSYNPFIYWSAAYFTQKYHQRKLFVFISSFYVIYGILYIIMFSCFYPPA